MSLVALHCRHSLFWRVVLCAAVVHDDFIPVAKKRDEKQAAKEWEGERGMAKVPQEPISGFGLGVWTDGDVAAGPDVQIKCHCGPNFKFFKRPPSKRPFAQSLLRKIAFLPEKPRMPSFFLPQPKSAPFSARPIAASAVLCASSAISQYFSVRSSYTRTTEHTYLPIRERRTDCESRS